MAKPKYATEGTEAYRQADEKRKMLEWVDYRLEDVVYDLTQCSSPIEANTHKRDRAMLQAIRSLIEKHGGEDD